MVDPDAGGHAAAVTDGDEVPVVGVVVASRRLVPLPQFVELEIAQDEIGAALDVEFRVADRRAVAREDSESVERRDVEQADAARDQRRVLLRRDVRAQQAVGLQRRVPISFQPMLRSFMISMTLTGLAIGRLRGVQRGDQFGRRGHLAIARIGVGNVAAARH